MLSVCIFYKNPRKNKKAKSYSSTKFTKKIGGQKKHSEVTCLDPNEFFPEENYEKISVISPIVCFFLISDKKFFPRNFSSEDEICLCNFTKMRNPSNANSSLYSTYRRTAVFVRSDQ